MITSYMISVMQAFEDGKEIEELCTMIEGSDWTTVSNPAWNWSFFNYRIKPESKYVPYDSVEEVEKDKWIVDKTSSTKCRIGATCGLNDSVYLLAGGWRKLDILFAGYTYEDGTPCGKMVEE